VRSAHNASMFVSAMGQQELFAQQTFANETEAFTRGAASWQDPPEIRLGKDRATDAW
jgi:hypothetical protein